MSHYSQPIDAILHISSTRVCAVRQRWYVRMSDHTRRNLHTSIWSGLLWKHRQRSDGTCMRNGTRPWSMQHFCCRGMHEWCRRASCTSRRYGLLLSYSDCGKGIVGTKCTGQQRWYVRMSDHTRRNLHTSIWSGLLWKHRQRSDGTCMRNGTRPWSMQHFCCRGMHEWCRRASCTSQG